MNSLNNILSFDAGASGYWSLINIEYGFFTLLSFGKLERENITKYKVGKKMKDDFQVDFVKNRNKIKIAMEQHNATSDRTVGLFEQLSPRPIYSCSSNFGSGANFAVNLCLLQALGCDFKILQPSKIKNGLGISKDKTESIKLFQTLLEEGSIKTSIELKKMPIKNHNFVESVLIAYYYKKMVMV